MSSGDVNHIRLSVSNLSESLAFYTNLLAALNYGVAHQTSQTISFHHRTSPLAFILSQASESFDRIHSRNAPGLHHLAFHASCKEDVDRVYRDVLLRRIDSIGRCLLGSAAVPSWLPAAGQMPLRIERTGIVARHSRRQRTK